MTKRKIEYWVIPDAADGEFVAHMEEVLDTYEKAYDFLLHSFRRLASQRPA
jgi:hypothetical protein